VTLNAQILLQLLATENSSSDLSTTVRRTNVSESLTFTNGTGANQAQIVWSDSRTIAAGSNESIDLLSLDDDRGTLVFSAIKAIYVRATGASSVFWTGFGVGDDWDTGPLQAPAASGLFIPPGGLLLVTNPSAAGWAVAAPSNEIAIQNSSETAAATYDIILIGEGAIGS
jgi:hypothetical protein